jgi:hypothetical protein
MLSFGLLEESEAHGGAPYRGEVSAKGQRETGSLNLVLASFGQGNEPDGG